MPDQAEIVAKLRRSIAEEAPSDSPYVNEFSKHWWQGYKEAMDLAIRIVEDRHTMQDCCNVHCNSLVPPWHCWECDETETEYGAEHIREHAPHD